MKYLILISLLVPTTLSANSYDKRLNILFKNAANKYQVPVKLLKSICWVESRHRERAINLKDGSSPSYGICQVKIISMKHMGFKYSPKQLQQAENNIFVAAKYLSYHMQRYDGNVTKAVISYNRGHYKQNVKFDYASKVFNALAKEEWNR